MSNSEWRAALLRQVVQRSGPVVLTSDDWQHWLWLARMDRAVPLLYQLVEQTPTDLDDDQRAELRQLFGATMCRCVQLEHHHIAVSELLASNGIRCVVLKGGATAHLDYPDPSYREFSDIDLLIDTTELARATELVERAGWAQGYALPAGHKRFTHAVTFIKEGMELDLHQRISRRSLGYLLPTADLLARAVPFVVADSQMFALDDVDRFIHSTVHAVASGGANQRLSSLADILIVAEQRPDLAEAVLERADSMGVRSLVQRGIEDTYRTAKLDLGVQWAAAMARPIRNPNRLVDLAYLEAWRRPVYEELAHLRQLNSLVPRARYIAGYFFFEQTRLGPRFRYLWSKLRGTR